MRNLHLPIRSSVRRAPLPTALLPLLAGLLATSFQAPGLVESVRAQGVLVDTRTNVHFQLPRPWRRIPPQPQQPEVSYKIESLAVDATLQGSVARVQVSQTFVNTSNRQIEASFLFPLPYDGAIDQLTLLVDGKEYAAELLTKEEARRRYEAIVRQNKDPALLEWVGVGMFQTSVFPIPAGAKRTVTLRYAQICRQSYGLTDFRFPLSTAKYTAEPLEKLRFRITVAAEEPIKNVYSASHAVAIERPDDRHATITHEQSNVVPGEDFRLFYDVGENQVGASVVSYRTDKSSDGYFLMLATPELPSSNLEQVAKTVVFVVDRSGSMSGEKMKQARDAAKFVLNNLREGDLFNIVAYDSDVETFRPELQRFDEKSRTAALGFINSLYAGGSTNIDAALGRALPMLQDSQRPSYVIFLTDGLPTVGVTNEASIVANAEHANGVRARLFAFGVGYDVNSRLLDKLVRGNFGQSEYVRPDEDIEASVSKLYRRIQAPVMTNVNLEFVVKGGSPADGPAVQRVYPAGDFDLFAGDQLVVVGRYQRSGPGQVKLIGKLGDEQHKFHFPMRLVEESSDDSNAFVAKLWATRRVGEIIDEMDLRGKNDELVKELIELATQHGILTPYTSFLADENGAVQDVARLSLRAAREADALEQLSGEFGVRQRAIKGRLRRAAAAPADHAYGRGGFGGAALEESEMRKLQSSSGRGVRFFDARDGREKIANTVFTIGRKTFFRRGEAWVDASVTAEDEQNVEQIERFSREYFDLIERHGQHVARYLAVEDAVTIKLDGRTYRW